MACRARSPRFQRHRVLEVEDDADVLRAALEELRVLRNQRPDDLLDAVQLVQVAVAGEQRLTIQKLPLEGAGGGEVG